MRSNNGLIKRDAASTHYKRKRLNWPFKMLRPSSSLQILQVCFSLQMKRGLHGSKLCTSDNYCCRCFMELIRVAYQFIMSASWQRCDGEKRSERFAHQKWFRIVSCAVSNPKLLEGMNEVVSMGRRHWTGWIKMFQSWSFAQKNEI